MTAAELEGIPVEELFEPVTSLPDDRDLDRSLLSTQEERRLQQARERTGSSAVETPEPTAGGILSGRELQAQTPLPDVRFLTVAEVALIMRVSKITVYRLVHTGELEAIKVGRSFRVPEAAVNQYLRGTFLKTT
jgi:excisionase family DNA binding protein